MKKIIPVMLISFALVGCTNQGTPKNEANNNQAQESEQTDGKQVIEVKKAEDNQENKEEASKAEQNKEDEEDSSYKEDNNDDEHLEKDQEDDNEENEESDNKEISKDDLFFTPNGPFTSVNENGELVDENGNVLTGTDSNHYDYVKYTNNVFVKMKNDLYDTVSIVRMNDKNIETLFEFPEADEFRPLGMIGDKIYGFHEEKSKTEVNGTPSLNTDKSAIGYVDLASGEIHDFDATAEELTGGAVVIDGELQFTKPGDNSEQNAYNFDLYKLDLSKGTDQQAELLEKDFDLQYLFGQKRFENGNPVWKVYRADNDHIYANDQEFPFLWAEQGFQEIIGNNIFYFDSEEVNDRLSRPIKIINMSTGETVLDTQIRGMKISDGKLYYLTTDNELESIDIEL